MKTANLSLVKITESDHATVYKNNNDGYLFYVCDHVAGELWGAESENEATELVFVIETNVSDIINNTTEVISFYSEGVRHTSVSLFKKHFLNCEHGFRLEKIGDGKYKLSLLTCGHYYIISSQFALS
jgi:hypothetical protein